MASVSEFRRKLLHVPTSTGSEGRQGVRHPYRASSALLHRSERCRPDRGALWCGIGGRWYSSCVFKAPAEGRTHIFRAGKAFRFGHSNSRRGFVRAQADGLTMRRPSASYRHGASTPTVGNSQPVQEWTSSSDTVFDGTYRHLHRGLTKDESRQGFEIPGKKPGPRGPVSRHILRYSIIATGENDGDGGGDDDGAGGVRSR